MSEKVYCISRSSGARCSCNAENDRIIEVRNREQQASGGQTGGFKDDVEALNAPAATTEEKRTKLLKA